MPKRSAQEKLNSYREKIRKIEEREKRKKNHNRSRIRRVIESPDSSDNDNNGDNVEPPLVTEMQASPITTVLETFDPASPAQNAAEPEQDSIDPIMEPPLELLSALGASTSATPEFGANVHDSVANLWTPILKKGLPGEEKDKLLKEYLPPGNCTMLQAPKLNAEISAAATDMVRGRDKKLLKFQQQLGVGTAANGRGIDTLLKSNNKVLALTQISDGCRFLTDLHYLLSKDRIKLVSHGLEKNFLTVIQDGERDETLFGNSLSEKIKASLAISKQSAQIKATTNQRAGINPMQSHVTRPNQGNWSGPPRYPTNRGGRGGQRKSTMVAPPRRAYRPPAQTQTRAPKPSRPRAAPQ